MQKTLTRKLLLHKISIQLNVHFMQKLALAFCTECTIVLALYTCTYPMQWRGQLQCRLSI